MPGERRHDRESAVTTGIETAEATKKVIYDVGGSFMLAPETAAYGAGKGYPEMVQFYLGGRCGVLGDVDPAVVVAGFGFLAPQAAAQIWPAVLAVGPARETSARYAEACAAYGRAKLADMAGGDATRLAELLGRVVDTAEVIGLPLFAGWKAMPRPADPREKAMHLIHVIREWRGSVHIACVAAAGISALDAIMLNGGPGYAEMFGWPQPWGEGNGREADMADAERATTAVCGAVFDSALSADEQTELVGLTRRAAALISPPE